MAQKLLTISLGASSAKLSVVSKSGNKVTVYSCFDWELPEGVCNDGVILDVDALASELKHFISSNKIKTKKLVFSIASTQILCKEVIIPFVKENQIKNIIEENAPEYFPLEDDEVIEDYVLNYSIVEIVKTSEKPQYRLNVTATPNDMLFRYTELAALLRCDIDTIDYARNAVTQVLKYENAPGVVSAILQFNYNHIDVNIMNGQIPVMQRTVDTGLDSLIAAVCESVKLDEEDAKAFLEDNDIERIARAYPDVNKAIDAMLSGVTQIFALYNSKSSDHTISKVKYLGDASYINGIDYVLETKLDLSAEEISKLTNVEIRGKSVDYSQVVEFIESIGAVVNPMHISYENKSTKSRNKGGKLPIWSIVLALIIAVAIILPAFRSYRESQARYMTLSGQVDSLKPMQQLRDEFDETAEKADAIGSVYDATQGPNDSIPNLVDDLENILPKGMSIETLSIDEGKVSITAGGVGKKSVSKFITGLKSVSYIDNVHIDDITETNNGNEKYDVFTITFTISAPQDALAESSGASDSDISDN